MKILTFLILFLLLTLNFFACNKDTSPLVRNDYIDPSLFGAWVKLDSIPLYGLEILPIRGVNITENGTIFRIAVETNTGRLSYYDSNQKAAGKIRYAYNGKIRLEVYGFGFAWSNEFNGYYQRSNQIIKFYEPDFSNLPLLDGSFKKSQLGEVITDPILSEMTVQIDTHIFTNKKVSLCPSAYARNLTSDTGLKLKISGSNFTEGVAIIINNFNGTGQYTIGVNNDAIGIYSAYMGDVIYSIRTQTDNSGFITIVQFDSTNKRCSGTFEFQIDSLTFSNGKFDIPVYISAK